MTISQGGAIVGTSYRKLALSAMAITYAASVLGPLLASNFGWIEFLYQVSLRGF